MHFKHKKLLNPPIMRAAYSDRMAWLMAEMSKLAYLKFEDDTEKLKKALSLADFELVEIFNKAGTQAFLAKRYLDKIMVLAFRGTEVKEPRDILTDLNAKFYNDDKGIKIHNGFNKAFELVKQEVIDVVGKIENFSLYVTGHSLGGALALIATKTLNSDNLAACYTFGSPRVGNEEFDDEIKPPIYRVVNAFDILPSVPPEYLFEIINLLPWKWSKNLAKKFIGYAHHGDMRYLTDCKDFPKVKLISNYNEFFRLVGLWKNKKESVKHHEINIYCEKLAQYALKRLIIK